jgi:hypothetical protein
LAGLYGLFTLLPNSTSRMITWPWVVLWQALVTLPFLWLLWRLWYKPWRHFRLGHGLDGVALVTLGVLLLSSWTAPFPQMAWSQSWAAIAGLAALYGLVGWLTTARARFLLKAQGYLGLTFVLLSLLMWGVNTYLPELNRLADLRDIGIEQSFNLSILGLRNGFPLGHQNYVAGYLVPTLPLFAALAWTEKNVGRWLWLTAIALGLLTLYTTSSRAGILGLVALLIPAIIAILWSAHLPGRIALPVSFLGLGAVGLLILTNPRLQLDLTALNQGQTTGGQVAYRLITNAIGWRMGRDRWWLGQGPGSVPLLYQRFRPIWAGREAEWHHQLHSTPAHLWAELGIWGIVLPFGAAVLLTLALWRGRQPNNPQEPLPLSLIWSLAGALWGYSVLALTDYQLDVVAIAGVLILYLAVLIFALRPYRVLAAKPAAPMAPSAQQRAWQRRAVGVGIGGLGVLLLTLIPTYRAWAAASQGFLALAKQDYAAFATQLEKAHRLAPWEPYYPAMLGWVTGDVSYQLTEPAANEVRSQAIAHLQAATTASPYQEFNVNNLGWLQIEQGDPKAISAFAQAAHLLPAKVGVFFGLGYSLIQAQHSDLATEALALEWVRHPLAITSPLWRSPTFAPVLPAIAARTEALLTELLDQSPTPALMTYLYQVRGTLRWWQGDLAGANKDWETHGSPNSRAVLGAAQGSPPDIEALPGSPGQLALRAWYDPENRAQWLTQAWVTQPEHLPLQIALPSEAVISDLVNSMEQAGSLDDWLKRTAPPAELRHERLGFGIFSRHDDGPGPRDFYFRVENLPMLRFFPDLVPSAVFLPALDEGLQPYRDALITQSITLGDR